MQYRLYMHSRDLEQQLDVTLDRCSGWNTERLLICDEDFTFTTTTYTVLQWWLV